MAEKSTGDPMASMVTADRVINELYGSEPDRKLPKSVIFEAAAKAPIAPDVMTYFTHLEDRAYTRKELLDALNKQVKARHREQAIGLFGVGPAEEEAERQIREMRA
ncbi:MAG: hypothetical protein IRY83_09200 [Chloroflexi bacterium]|nr:hypothetical protein [Chloroflexota bacterium]HLG50406.1 hypothetical protein [Chloroflexota bacterium]